MNKSRKKIGGRKALKLTGADFEKKILDWIKKKKDILIGEACWDDISDNPEELIRVFYENIGYEVGVTGSEGLDKLGLTKAYKDLHDKFNLYFENISEPAMYSTLDNGFPYLHFEGSSDYSPIVHWFFYWDGSSWRSYLPVRGNYLCPKTKMQFCKDYSGHDQEKQAFIDSGIIPASMSDPDFEDFFDKILEEDLDYSSLELCIDEFKSRLEII